jgi:16S rRNA (uracil1498-N3)-methyltransferase
MIRLFVRASLAQGGEVSLDHNQAHYLTRVMRLVPGDEVAVFNGADGEWRARLAGAGRRDFVLVAEALIRPQTTTPDLELLAAVVKRPRLETIVEKAAELGARRVRLMLTERTNAERANLPRLEAIVREAAEQCERLDAPQILAPERLADRIAQWEADRALLFCDEAGDAPPAGQALAGASDGPWAILIGPEGGFSPAERAAIRALPQATPVGLGPRILRADTAAIAALTLWQSALGDWRGT